MNEIKLSKRELQTVFYVGRKVELVECLVPMAAPQGRTVKAQRSYGYDMERPDGKVSRLDFESGQQIFGVSPAGNGFTEVVVRMKSGEVAARYRLLAKVTCPQCGADVWDVAFASKLNKCWGCGLAFDSDYE